ncbi:MAG TPA: glycerophosphoryl diester phosphodiesterase membrane domain-containing protein [Allosphingosinicella sp.]|jgi:membrane-anchored glycerophosphoryl diester phosphodiesterase (GDPDase)|nr:glycerophosphoryl diester phosphodiesterase membrane domain-containing protein [Allosphingosinicella sp.]
MKLSITKAWDETSAFVKQEGSTLFLIVFALTVLPGLIMQAVAGRLVGPIPAARGGTPDLGPLMAAVPILLAMLIPVIILSLWGNLTINLLAMRRETVVGSAFARAARRILPLLGATLLFFVAAMIVAFPILAAAGFGVQAGRFGLVALLFLALFLLAIFFGVRLMLMSPVAAAEEQGPIGIIRRSWQLTSGHFWRLLGFLALLMVVIMVLVIVVGSVGGILITLVAGQMKPGSLGSFLLQLLTGILQAVWATYFIVMVARIYAQLSGNSGSAAAVFE